MYNRHTILSLCFIILFYWVRESKFNLAVIVTKHEPRFENHILKLHIRTIIKGLNLKLQVNCI